MGLRISQVDPEKWYFRIAMDWFIKKYTGGKNFDIIHDELVNCGNPIIRRLFKIKEKVISNISKDEKHQVTNIDKATEFLLWIMNYDTAYRQIFVWALQEILNDKKLLENMIRHGNYYTKPDEWYLNVWSKAKKETKEQIEKGEILETGKSLSETYFMPNIMKKRSLKILQDEARKELEFMRRKKGVK
jgi:hypothetical protein